MCKQEPGEAIRSYVKRFFDTRATITNVADDDVIYYFHDSITTQSLYRDFGRNHPKTVVELRDMMQRWADEEEQERNRFPRHNNDNNGKRNNDRGGPVTSGILRASTSQTTPSALWIAPRAVRKQKSLWISLTRSCITRGAQSTPRVTTRCLSAQSYASPSSPRC
jgi:hypothetical protein